MTTIPTMNSAPSTQITISSPASAAAKVALAIAMIGALNWGLIGVFHFDLVQAIFGCDAGGHPSMASQVVYSIIGLCGLVSVFLLPKLQLVTETAPAYRRNA